MSTATGQHGDSLERELRGAMAQRAASAAPPERIGRYRIERELGSGGMGTVFLARDDELDRAVAIKLIRGALLHEPEARRRFRREALAAARLDHPGICHLYEIGEVDDVPYMVMRYVAGQPLSQLIGRCRQGGDDPAPPASILPASTRERVSAVVHLVEQAARALHVAHTQGLVHRDVKPANLMVTPDGAPVVLDFGVVHDEHESERSLTLTGQMIGTPLYMSPEQVRGEPGIDGRADVYGLAVTLYELLTLERPFEAPTQHGIYERILGAEPISPRKRNPAVGHDLEVVVATGMHKDRARRYRTAMAFADDLQCVRERRPITARPPGLVRRVADWTVRNPTPAAMLSVLAAASGGMGLLWRDARASDERFRLTASAVALGRLEQRQAELYPSRPEKAGALRHWLQEAQGLADRLPTIRRALAGEADAAGDDLSVFLRRTLQELRAGLEVLVADTIPRVQGRLAVAESVERATVQEPAEAWRRSAAAAADPAGPYRGLGLPPQTGLIPLGADPASGLLEFAVWETGALPARDPKSGGLAIDESAAIVLVLLPGGEFEMGVDDPPPPGGVPPFHHPRHRVRALAPFFIGKYEITQAQWLSVMGTNPSSFQPARPFRSRGGDQTYPISLLHPVEGVTAEEAIAALARIGLTLPTEAQWEYAACAGSPGIWPTGDDPGAVEGTANLRDRASARFGVPGSTTGWDDGFPCHAPIGRFAANQFGLHDCVGNVAEWCSDWRGLYGWETLPVTGERLVPQSERTARAFRGASWSSSIRSSSPRARDFIKAGSAGDAVGARAARPLDR